MMKPEDLLKVWDAPDHSRLTPKQISIRLPILVSAKLSALNEMYPSKNKSQMICDLIATAIDQLEQGFPVEKGEIIGEDPDTGKEIYREYRNVENRYRELTTKYLRELEQEIGVDEPIEF